MVDIMDGVPRGDRIKYLRQQRGPQAAWLPVADILKSAPLSYDPNSPGRKILVGAIDQHLIGIADNRHMMTVAGSRAGKSVSLIKLKFPSFIVTKWVKLFSFAWEDC